MTAMPIPFRAIVKPRLSDVIDPAEYAAHELRKNRSALMDEVRSAVTFDRAMRLTEMVRELRDELDTLATIASAKADAISEAKN